MDILAGPQTAAAIGAAPLAPKSIAETGLNFGTLGDLALKAMYFSGYATGRDIADSMKLPFLGVVREVIEGLKKEELCDVTGSRGIGEAGFQWSLTPKGLIRVREVLARSQYSGPAPVPLEAYKEMVRRQTIDNVVVGEEEVRKALSHLVLADEVYRWIGPAVNSGRSLFLFGPPGNGKTILAEACAKMLGGDIYIPYAVDVDGETIKVFDQVLHKEVAPQQAKPADDLFDQEDTQDRRWVLSKRPVVIVGGELTLASLDLIYNDIGKFYEAPFQMKANNGMFMIDDFGRQLVRPQDLLNRWIYPLEKRIDYLTLKTGKKIDIPFDELIIFSTNLAPKDLVDEAFLRRIRYKIEVGNPTFEQYREIFKRMCGLRKVPYDEEKLRYLLRKHYVEAKRELRSCHPRDIIDQLIDMAHYMKIEPVLREDLIDRACQAYFVKL